MTRPDRPLIDIGRALDLLAAAVRDGDGLACLVGHALSLAQVGADDLDALGGRGLRELYREDALPARLTLGALVVLDAAQQAEDRGDAWDDALDYARSVAIRFLDLVPAGAYECPSPELS